MQETHISGAGQVRVGIPTGTPGARHPTLTGIPSRPP